MNVINVVRPHMDTFEDILDLIGWGAYHKLLVGISISSFFVTSLSETSIPFSTPLILCHFKFKDDFLKVVNIMLNTGIIFGSLVIPSISDTWDRRHVVTACLLFTFISDFLCGFSSDYLMFFVCIFLMAFSISATNITVRINMAEMLERNRRGKYILLLDIFKILGYLAITGFSWLIPPRSQKPLTFGEKLSSHLLTWRLFMGISAGACLICACFTALLQPNPRVLLAKKQRGVATLALKHIFAMNNSEHAENFKVPTRELDGLIKELPLYAQPSFLKCGACAALTVKRIARIVKLLFKGHSIKIVVMVAILRLFVVGEFFATNIWLTKSVYFNSTDPSCVVNVIDLFVLKSNGILPFNCDGLSSELYMNFSLIAGSCIIGLIIACLMVDRIGAKIILVTTLTLCAFSSFLLRIPSQLMVRMLLSVIYMSCHAISNSLIEVILVENLPTIYRGIGTGITVVPENLMMIFVKSFMWLPCNCIYYCCGIMMFAAAVLGYFLPDLTRRPMVE